VDPDSACVAFRESNDVETDWKCLDENEVTKKKDFLVIESQTTHFTLVCHSPVIIYGESHITLLLRTFAVLFQASDSCDRWIWIASLSMVAFCCCFSLLMGGLYFTSRRVRAVVGGFKAKHISSVLKHAEAHQ